MLQEQPNKLFSASTVITIQRTDICLRIPITGKLQYAFSLLFEVSLRAAVGWG
jgi:hypothetical protein